MLSLVRLDATLLQRIRTHDRLGGIASSAIATILVGAGLYGFAFGFWRGIGAAIFSSVKLPALVLGVAALTTLASGLIAPLLRSALSLRQTGIAILVSFAVTSALLGALAPVSIAWVWMQRPMAAVVGLAATDPRAIPSIDTAQALVLFHTAVIAVAGIAGVVRLLGLLHRLEPRGGVVRRLVVTWIGLQFLVGAELAWITRPFLGRPHLPVAFVSPEALNGSFFEEILLLARSTFGVGAPAMLSLFGIGIAGWLVNVLRASAEPARIEVLPRMLAVLAPIARTVPWSSVLGARAEGHDVRIRLAADATLVEEELVVGCPNGPDARRMAARIERARQLGAVGPFRTVDEPLSG